MIRFLLKGLIRDSGRSRVPMLVVAIGVTLTVFMHAYVNGVMGDTIEMNARFSTGHLKVMSRAYAAEAHQIPNDLALMGSDSILAQLKKDYPQADWSARILFGGMIDIPDANGETKSQAPAMGIALELLDKNATEDKRLKLSSSIVQGKMPLYQGEVLLSDNFAKKLQIKPGEQLTLIGSSMNGAMVMHNYTLAGTIRFGVDMLDRGTILMDISDAREVLDMQDATGEILGFLKSGNYDSEDARYITDNFNAKYANNKDEYAPKMFAFEDNADMGIYIQLSAFMSFIISAVFIFAMALVLWNTGLLGGLRRYGEIGVRLAIGEEKKHVYWSMILESVMIGIAGSVIGTACGLGFAWLMQTYGIEIGDMIQGSSVMMPSTIKAHITQVDFYIGLIPGILAIVIGTALAGIGIYKRKTAELFKELEA